MKKYIYKHMLLTILIALLAGCSHREKIPEVSLIEVTETEEPEVQELHPVIAEENSISIIEIQDDIETECQEETIADISGNNVIEEYNVSENEVSKEIVVEEVFLMDSMEFAENSMIHTDPAMLYHNNGADKEGIVICVNAGHGTKGGTQVKTLCHPDGTPKVTGGSTAEGSLTAIAVSSGMDFKDGIAERTVTLQQAMILKELLLDAGYSVLMIRESEDVQLDNIARTVLANEYADCHIALHWDSSENDKGAFYCSVPDVESYRKMYPVCETWEKSHIFGDCIIEGLKNCEIKIYNSGSMPIDLTQTSYSKIPSIDLELGDKGSDRSEERLRLNAEGILEGIELYFEKDAGNDDE